MELALWRSFLTSRCLVEGEEGEDEEEERERGRGRGEGSRERGKVRKGKGSSTWKGREGGKKSNEVRW